MGLFWRVALVRHIYKTSLLTIVCCLLRVQTVFELARVSLCYLKWLLNAVLPGHLLLLAVDPLAYVNVTDLNFDLLDSITVFMSVGVFEHRWIMMVMIGLYVDSLLIILRQFFDFFFNAHTLLPSWPIDI